MERGVIEPTSREADCACSSGASLAVLQDVQRAYEDRLALVDKIGGPNKLQKQVEVLQSWVADVVAQNTLLSRTVEELEKEITTRMLRERARYNELVSEARAEAVSLRRAVARKDSDVRALLEVLRRLREFDLCSLDGIHFFEVTESDIFGTIEWPEEKHEQGDTNKKYKPQKRRRKHR